MKKLILVFSIILFSCQLFAQSDFCFFGGLQTTNSKFMVGSNRQATENKYGFHFGVAKKVTFDNQIYFFPSVSYSLKGYQVSLQNPSFPPGLDVVHGNTTFHTVDISPLFQVDLGKNPGHLFIRFGPGFDFAIAGKEELIFKNGTTENKDMVFNFATYGRVGASLISQIGYEKAKQFFISARYDHGVGSVSNSDGGPKINHRVLALSFGLYITKSKS